MAVLPVPDYAYTMISFPVNIFGIAKHWMEDGYSKP